MGRGRHGSGVEALKETIRLRFTWSGKRRTETLPLKPTPANIRAAERLMAQIRLEMAVGAFDYAKHFPDSVEAPKPVPTFDDFAQDWLAAKVVAKSTRKSYRPAIAAWSRCELQDGTLGAARLDTIKPLDLAKAVKALADRVAAKTVNNYLIALFGVIEAAAREGHCAAGIADGIGALRWQKKEPDPFTPAEADAIVAWLYDHKPVEVAAYYDFALATGLRPSEQIALRWGDVDWNRPAARVERARVLAEIKPTKTYEARDVDLNPRALAALQRAKPTSFMRGFDAPIFQNPLTGRPWNDTEDQTAYLHAALRALGIRKRDAYNTRHTFATRLLMAGVKPAWIARQLGHKNLKMLLEHYARWLEDADGGAEALRANAAFGHALATAKSRA